MRRFPMGVIATIIALAILSSAGPVQAEDQPTNPPEGFQALFNGKNLEGWGGDTKGYVANEGLLVAAKNGGGNLYTEKQYANFVFRFDFQLQPGGNNGVGLRCEKGKNAAYHGMEIQILDDSSPQYAKLKPYQYHGSIYGVVPAKRGFLKPVGEWNSEEITANGSHITVKLNGTVIVDADIEKAGKPMTMDGLEHPGLFNTTGHIAFLGHGHELKFRNLFIKELE
jgi:3-keto-disaccharide hydrolase